MFEGLTQSKTCLRSSAQTDCNSYSRWHSFLCLRMRLQAPCFRGTSPLTPESSLPRSSPLSFFIALWLQATVKRKTHAGISANSAACRHERAHSETRWCPVNPISLKSFATNPKLSLKAPCLLTVCNYPCRTCPPHFIRPWCPQAGTEVESLPRAHYSRGD